MITNVKTIKQSSNEVEQLQATELENKHTLTSPDLTNMNQFKS